MEPDQPDQASAPEWSRRPVGRRGLSRLANRPGKLAAVAMPIRRDHFVASGGQVKMPGGEVDRFQQVGILAKDSRGAGREPSPGKAFGPIPNYPAEK